MEQNRMMMGHMSYDDPPTFESKADWEWEQTERKETYENDLYKFDGDEIIITELIGDEPIGHIYKNSFQNDDYEESEEDNAPCQSNKHGA